MKAEGVAEMKLLIACLNSFGHFNYTKEYIEKRSKFLMNSLRKLPADKVVKEEGYKRGSHPYIFFLRLCLKLLKVQEHSINTYTIRASTRWPSSCWLNRTESQHLLNWSKLPWTLLLVLESRSWKWRKMRSLGLVPSLWWTFGKFSSSYYQSIKNCSRWWY